MLSEAPVHSCMFPFFMGCGEQSGRVGRAGEVNTGHLTVTKQKKKRKEPGSRYSLLKFTFSDSPALASLYLLAFPELSIVAPPTGNQALNTCAYEGHFLSEHTGVSLAVVVRAFNPIAWEGEAGEF